MKALVKKSPEPGLWLENVPTPQISINDVLIKIHKTSICGTDLHIFNWDAWAQKTIKPPMVIGHEFVGTIEKMGSNVHDFKLGDLVSGEGHLVCGRCRNCLAGRRHLCKDPKGIGVNRDGAFAEYLAIPVTNVWYCDTNIPQFPSRNFVPRIGFWWAEFDRLTSGNQLHPFELLRANYCLYSFSITSSSSAPNPQREVGG